MAGIKIPTVNQVVWGVVFALGAMYVVKQFPAIKRFVA